MNREPGLTPTVLVVRAVGWITFRELVRDKVLYNILLCSALLFGVSFLASRLTFIRPDRVLLDFGLSAVRLSCAMIATFNGAAMLGREIERRTILETWESSGKNLSAAARILGLPRTTLRDRLRKYGLR